MPKGGDAVASEAERADWQATIRASSAAGAPGPADLRRCARTGVRLCLRGSKLCRFARVRSRIGAFLFHFRSDGS